MSNYFSIESVDSLRKKYPNAMILGWIKEVWVGEPFQYTDPRHLKRIEHESFNSVISNTELKWYLNL